LFLNTLNVWLKRGAVKSVSISACLRVSQAISGIASLQGAGRQIGVLVFELAVEGEPPFIFVVGQKGCQHEHLAQRETRTHRASLPDSWTYNQHECQCATMCYHMWIEISREINTYFLRKLSTKYLNIFIFVLLKYLILMQDICYMPSKIWKI